MSDLHAPPGGLLEQLSNIRGWKYEESGTTKSRERRWYIIGKNIAIHGWFCDTQHSRYGGVEIHRFCHEDFDCFPCDVSPTGFCSPDGSRLAGDRVIAYWPDEAAIWRYLAEWYRDREGE